MLASSREPCGGVRFPGRAMALPYKPSEYARQKGTVAAHPGDRRAGMPSSRRTLRRRKRPRADMESAPTVNGRVCDQPGTATLSHRKPIVGDDACIVLGTPRRRKVPGRAMALPYKPSEYARPKRERLPPTRAIVGRDALIPPDPAAAPNVCGRIWNPPLRSMVGYTTNREPQPCRTANPCRGRCLHRPAHPAAPQTPWAG